MLFTLIRREITGNVLSFRFIVTFVLFFSLVLVSVFILTREYQARLQSYESSLSAHRKALDEVKQVQDANQRYDDLFVSKGVYGDIRPARLGVFVDGLEPEMPSQVHAALINPRTVDEDLYRNPLMALFASPDSSHLLLAAIAGGFLASRDGGLEWLRVADVPRWGEATYYPVTHNNVRVAPDAPGGFYAYSVLAQAISSFTFAAGTLG